MKTKAPTAPASLKALRQQLDALAGSGLPLFARLREAIRHCMSLGLWRAGERLPTELDLAAASGMSVGTVQRALRALVEEGLVLRTQGSGSYVAEPPDHITDASHCRFLADDGRSILPVYSKVLARRAAAAAGPWSAHLGAASGPVTRIDRLLDVNHEFTVFSSFWFETARCPALATRPFSQLAGVDFKALLRDAIHQPVSSVGCSLQLQPLDGVLASRLQVKPGSMGAQLEVLGHAGKADPVFYQLMTFPPVPRKLVMQRG